MVLLNIRYIISLPLPRASLGGSAGKESACNVGALGLIPRLGRSPEEGKGYPFQYSGLENSMDCVVHGVTKSLINFHFPLPKLFKDLSSHSGSEFSAMVYGAFHYLCPDPCSDCISGHCLSPLPLTLFQP